MKMWTSQGLCLDSFWFKQEGNTGIIAGRTQQRGVEGERDNNISFNILNSKTCATPLEMSLADYIRLKILN